MSSPPSSQSKLKTQLQKQQHSSSKVTQDDDRIDSIFEILTKKQLKNLMFIELLTFLIQKGFVKYQHKIHYFLDLYDSIRGHSIQDIGGVGQKNKVEEEDKFNRKKFVKLFKELAKKMYPCDQYGFENNIFKVITGSQNFGDVRMKIDESVKKILQRQTINVLRNCERELQLVFQIYMPQNFNKKLAFSWQQIKYLQRKLPIMSVFRFLWDSQICPHHISPTHFLEIASKLIPPHSLLAQSSQKQAHFYNSQTILNYLKEPITQKRIKLVQGDIGVNYLEFQIFLIKLSVEITKQKNDFTKAFEGFLGLSKLKEIIACKGQSKGKPNKFEEAVKCYFDQTKKANNKNLCVQKTETKKKIEEVLQPNDISLEQQNKFEFKDENISLEDLVAIKKSIQQQLPPIPKRSKVQKQNDKNYNIEAKNIVIGQQLPKIPQKNKPVAAPKKNDKKDDLTKKFKFEQPTSPKISSDYYNDIVKIHKKPRVNNEFPIILLDAVYPNDIPNLYISPKSEIYLETTYIHLGQRSYKKAFANYMKARSLSFENTRNQTAQFFFLILQAQIYQAAARDGMALLNYYKAKELTQNNKDIAFKYIVYKGLGCCLYHMEEYQYALRCFMKAKSLKQGQDEESRRNYEQSVERAVIENNIGCALMILNRNNEAMERFSLSERIMDLKLGKFHQRSIAVQQNERKNKKAYIQLVPQFKTMWKSYEQKPGIKVAVQKKK